MQSILSVCLVLIPSVAGITSCQLPTCYQMAIFCMLFGEFEETDEGRDFMDFPSEILPYMTDGIGKRVKVHVGEADK